MAEIVFIDLDGRPGGHGPQDLMNIKISHLAGVKDSVYRKGQNVAAKATINLSHHNTYGAGRHDIDTHKDAVDTVVDLVGPHALSVEVGHWEWVHPNIRTPEGYLKFLDPDKLPEGAFRKWYDATNIMRDAAYG